jgi:ribosomal protein S18 acetylase RimI-like enzyme
VSPAIAWRRSQDALQCDSVEPWRHGSVLRTPSLPTYWDANTVRVEDTGVSAPAMLAAADEHLADARHRKLDVEDEATGAAARPFFAALGWMNERHTQMRRVGPPPAPGRHTVREVQLPETRVLRLEWSSDVADAAFIEAQEPIWARRGMRAFMVGAEGFLTLARGPGAVEVDGLYVTPAARGDGIGAALLAAALRAGGEDTAWVIADDEGQARPLYERLGFETAWRFYNFVRVPS